jgi:hypothetical protein
VRDVSKAMILLYENPSVKGRHLCEEAISRFSDLVNKIHDLYPEYQVKRLSAFFFLLLRNFNICTLSKNGWYERRILRRS